MWTVSEYSDIVARPPRFSPCTRRSVGQDDDPNLAVLVDELAAIAADAAAEGIGQTDTRDRRKVLIFSYYADTVDWIHQHLGEAASRDERLAAYRGRIAFLSGTTGTESKEGVIWGFAPRTSDAPSGRDEDRYDIIVTTDVLAEGVNLQQARHIINYDLPWNPMRLVQRHGRIDRIGSTHSEVFLRCVFPDARLDEILGLEERLHRKLTQAAASIGVGEVLPAQEGRDTTFTETREEIERLRREDATLFERGGTTRGTLSGEEYRQELRKAIESGNRDRIEALPWGSGSGMAARSDSGHTGYVFCVRVGDWPQPLFRYIEATEEPTIVAETLACLDRARPTAGFDTPRTLDDDTHRGAFDAWKLARDDIVDRWNFLADKANLEPNIPATLRRAGDLLRKHPPPDLTQDKLDETIDSIIAPYTTRTTRAIRAAMATSTEPAQQVQNILQVIRDLGLQPYAPPKPLPEISADDVHLVCWMALVP